MKGSSCFTQARHRLNKRFVALYLITFLVVFPVLCFILRNSFCALRYDEDAKKQFLLTENSRRLEEAQRYFEMLDRTKLHEMLRHFNDVRTRGTLSVALTVVTVSRNRHKVDDYEPNYLTQVIWKILMLLHSVESEGFAHQVSLSICNVDHDPESYVEAINISRFVPVFRRFDKMHFSMVHPLEKEKQDYIFCLNRSLESDPDFVLVVEDDALPTSDFFHILDHTLTTHLDKRLLRGEFFPQHESIAYVKFFHPEWLLSFWSLERERIPELVSLTTLIGLALTYLYSSFCKSDAKSSTVSTYVCIFVYSFLLVVAIGRPNFNKLRIIVSPYLHTFAPAPSCCTPAMLFPAEGARQVVSYLDKVTCGNNFGKDSGLDRLLVEKGMKAYLVQPNTFTHIGLYSSLREKMVDPFIV